MPSERYHVEPHLIETLQNRLQARELAYKVFELAVKQGRGESEGGSWRLEELKSAIQFTTVAISYLQRRAAEEAAEIAEEARAEKAKAEEGRAGDSMAEDINAEEGKAGSSQGGEDSIEGTRTEEVSSPTQLHVTCNTCFPWACMQRWNQRKREAYLLNEKEYLLGATKR